MVLDGDEAGQRRTNEVLELFVAEQVDLRILTLPEGLDPCDFLHEKGAAAFTELLDNSAVDALEHAFTSVARGVDVDRDVHGASRALERLISIWPKPRAPCRRDRGRPIPRGKNPPALGGLVSRRRKRSAAASDCTSATQPRPHIEYAADNGRGSDTQSGETAGNNRSNPA